MSPPHYLFLYIWFDNQVLLWDEQACLEILADLMKDIFRLQCIFRDQTSPSSQEESFTQTIRTHSLSFTMFFSVFPSLFYFDFLIFWRKKAKAFFDQFVLVELLDCLPWGNQVSLYNILYFQTQYYILIWWLKILW